ncbi:MAG: hypothetical protein ABI239_01680 [Aquihabitans sp.]
MFVLAARNELSYNIMQYVHIGAMFVAFAFTFAGAKGANSVTGGSKLRKVYGPALAVGGLAGFGVAGMSEKVFRMSQPWLSVAALLWFIALGLVLALIAPAQDKVAEGDEGATKIVAAGTGGLHLILAVSLFLMIWKPGGPSL